MINTHKMLDKITLKEYNKQRSIGATRYLCHAPFTSINFEQNGNMRACCYNRADILGKYPQSSIKEAWFGKVAEQLRKDIKQNNLDNGCFTCKELLLAKNYLNTHAMVYDEYAGNKFIDNVKDFFGLPIHSLPKVFEFELSNKCNLECVMCNGYFSSSIRANREKLPKLENPYDDNFVEQVSAFLPHLTDVKFLGGEPFLIDIYYKIWEKIAEINPALRVHITTNATILNARAKDLMQKLKCNIVVSIDSLEKENYEMIRKNASFEKVLENIYYFIDYKKQKNTYVTLAACPMNNNWQYLPDMVTFANKHNIFIYFNNLWTPESLCIHKNSIDKKKEILEFWKSYSFKNVSSACGINVKVFNNLIQSLENSLSEQLIREKTTISNKIENKQDYKQPEYIPEDTIEKIKLFLKTGGYESELINILNEEPALFFNIYNDSLLEMCNESKKADVAQKIAAITELYNQLDDAQKKQYMTEGIHYGIENAVKFMENTSLEVLERQLKSSF